jgi:hypothetical protein
MVHSGDDDLIPSHFVVDSFSQVPDVARAPQNLHGVTGQGLEVGSGVGGGLRGPSPALCIGLSRGDILGATELSCSFVLGMNPIGKPKTFLITPVKH